MIVTLPAHDDPELSVVMVTHGAWPLVERAVTALVEHTPVPLELIVIDNASDRQTRARLSRLEGARVTLNRDNREFAGAVNQGAAQARSDLLLLLNSDAFVHPGWLEPLLETLAVPQVGAAVPRCLHPDGRLQEAGALLARDGTVIVYGDGADPDEPAYRFWRKVDFGSAVCMLTPAETFRGLGGFDERYTPAYYEDADFCMRLADHGLAAAYDPRSTVTHVRYGSGDEDAATEHSERNRVLFAERWGERLRGRPPTFVHATEQAVICARDALATPRVLLCSGPREPGAPELAQALLGEWPRARITWATDPGPSFDPGPWQTVGMEVLDQDPGWFEDRLFHYDVVVTGEQTRSALREALEHSQPQSARFALGELAPETLVPALATVGIAPGDRR